MCLTVDHTSDREVVASASKSRLITRYVAASLEECFHILPFF